MTKHGKAVPLRRQRDGVEDALLIRSAESLGRMIGSLQRQLEGASKKLSNGSDALKLFGMDGDEDRSNGDGNAKKSAGAKTRVAKGGGKSKATRARSTADRKSKHASKAAVAKKTAARSRSGAGRKASKSSRSR